MISDLLKNKVCIVTGSSRGIGRATAEVFASSGAEVIVNASTSGSADTWVAGSLYKEKIRPYYFDITDSNAVKMNIQEIYSQYGKIDVLVNNAGVEYNEIIGMISEDHIKKMLDVNVAATIMMTQYVSRVMQRNSYGGSIINIASIVGLNGNVGQSAYAASKGAIVSFTKSAAKELTPKKIRVNSIAPGITRTDMMSKVDESKLAERISNIKIGRIAEPEDIAKVCLFFASDLSAYVSGQTLAVDGCSVL